jgi:serine/threonine protein kinase
MNEETPSEQPEPTGFSFHSQSRPKNNTRFNTRKLRITTNTMDVDFINTSGIPSYTFQPGAVFNHYKILQAQDLSAPEMESWLAEDTRSGKLTLIRVYRRGITPRLDILETLRLLKGNGISEIYEVGQIQNQHFEVVEHVAFGSLRQHLDNHRMRETEVRTLVQELVAALNGLHQFGIYHQNVSAENVLLRSASPLHFILSNFSLAALADQSTPDSSRKRVWANTAPEALSGAPVKASDWWSLGMVILEALLGTHPYKGLSESDMLFKIVSQDIKIPRQIPEDWALLIKGLLHRDPLRRWQDMEVQDWLKGSGRYIADSTLENPTPSSSFAYKPIIFLGTSHTELPSLAHALGNHWESALVLLHSGTLEEWFKKDYFDPERQAVFDQILHDRLLTPELKLLAMLLLFSPALPLSYRGEVIHIEWLSKHPDFSKNFFESSLPSWIKKLNQEVAFEEWQEFRLELLSQLETFHVSCDPLKIEQYTLTDATELNRLHAEFCRRYVSSTHPALAEIMSRKQADLAETVLLLSADPSLFLTQEQVISLKNSQEMDQFMDYLHLFDLPMNYEKTSSLLSLQPEARLKEEYLKKWNKFTGSEHPLLNRIHHKTDPAAVEMIAYLIAPDCYLDPVPIEQRGLAKVFRGIKGITRRERDNSQEPVKKIPLPAFQNKVLQIAFTPDNLELIVLFEKGQLLGYSTLDGCLLRTYREEGDALEFITISPQGSYIAAIGSGIDHRIHLWDRRGSRGYFYLEGNLNEIQSLVFSMDEKEIFSGGVERLVRCWNIASGELTTKYEGHTFTITHLATNKIHDRLYSASANGLVVTWNHIDQQELFRREEHQYVGKMLFSNDGKVGVSVCLRANPDHTLRFHYWDSSTGEELQKLSFVHPGRSQEIIYDVSPSLEYFLIAEEGSMVLVSLQGQGNLLRWKLGKDQKPYTKIAFSGHGLRCATCNGNNELALWDLFEIYQLE